MKSANQDMRGTNRAWLVFAVGFALGVTTFVVGRLIYERVASHMLIWRYIKECEDKQFAGLAVRGAIWGTTNGIHYSPPQFVGGRTLHSPSIGILPVLTDDPALARRLLEDDRPSVRAWTAYVLLESERRLWPDTVAALKHLVLTDPNREVRVAALAAFDDPWWWTPPRLQLSAAECLAVLESDDPLSIQLITGLIGWRRCDVYLDDLQLREQVYERLVEMLEGADPALRWLAYEALRQLLDSRHLADGVVLTNAADWKLFDDAAYRFFFTASPVALRQAAVQIRQEATAYHKRIRNGELTVELPKDWGNN